MGTSSDRSRKGNKPQDKATQERVERMKKLVEQNKRRNSDEN